MYLDQNKPVSVSPWDASQEGTNQAEWDNGAINIWGTGSQFLAAGSYAYTRYTPWPNTDYLIETAFDETIQNSIKVYSGHLYSLTGGDLDTEMAHAKTVSDLSEFVEKIANASEVGRPFILGKLFLRINRTTRTIGFPNEEINTQEKPISMPTILSWMPRLGRPWLRWIALSAPPPLELHDYSTTNRP